MNKQKSNILTKLVSYDYDLPSELIAQQPFKKRSQARLLHLNRSTGEINHRRFFDLPHLLSAGDVLVFNDSKVIPARLFGTKLTGGKIEIFLLKHALIEDANVLQKDSTDEIIYHQVWSCLIRGKVGVGQMIVIAKDLKAKVLKKSGEKTWLVGFTAKDKKIFSYGQTPLPPYIKKMSKAEDYQTVYAKKSGSVAAPTAGLHFDKKLLQDLKNRGVQIEFVTLHVGLGTFLPVDEGDILKHKMHTELASVDASVAKRLNIAKQEGRKIIAVGTTVVRTLESFTDDVCVLNFGTKETDIFIYPGYRFRFVDALITNFHLPKSTLLMLVSAFAGNYQSNTQKSKTKITLNQALVGKKMIDASYQEAIKKKYRFFSFGDGMLID